MSIPRQREVPARLDFAQQDVLEVLMVALAETVCALVYTEDGTRPDRADLRAARALDMLSGFITKHLPEAVTE